MSNPEHIMIEDFGRDGYKVFVKRKCYNFEIITRTEGFIIEAPDEAQTDELIQVLEGVLEKLKNERLKKEVLKETEKRYEKKNTTHHHHTDVGNDYSDLNS